ncbi:MAG: caspase family protein [Sulfobacillus sp.]
MFKRSFVLTIPIVLLRSLSATALSKTGLYGFLRELLARQMVVVLDACFSGEGARSAVAPGIRPLATTPREDFIGRRITVLAASRGDQVAETDKATGHGLFTYYFLKELEQAPVPVQTLMGVVSEEVDKTARLADSRSQKPQFQGPNVTIP